MSSIFAGLIEGERATVPELLMARVVKSPERVFLRVGERQCSYGAMWEETERFSGFLEEHRLGGPAARVASYLSNRPETFWVWFGTQLNGATYVPLHREHKGEILADMIRRAGVRLLVTESSALVDLPGPEQMGLQVILLVDDTTAADEWNGAVLVGYDAVRAAKPHPGHRVKPSDIATLMYTSGTTGRSKGVLVPHNQLCRGGAWVAACVGIQPDDVFHGWLPLFHISAQLDMTIPLVLTGASIALFPTFSLSRFWSQVHEVQATVFGAFATQLELLWKLSPQENDADNPLRIGMVGHIPPQLHRPFEDRFGVRLFDIYGMTEAEPIALPRTGMETPVGSCGLPNPDFEVAILDENDCPLPTGEVGEIAIRPTVPDVMMRGYEGDEAVTVHMWRNLWFHTGDLGYCDADGFLYFVDRRKHAIRRRGENISSWELEHVLMRHPDVAECAAVGVPSPLGEEDVKVVLVPKPEASLNPAQVYEWCRSQMARFMVPRYIEVRRELPYTETGKVQKERLKTVDEGVWDAERALAQPES